MNHETGTANLGAVASVRGSVVDVRFDGHLPPIYSVLHAGTKNEIVIEVLAQSDARHRSSGSLKITRNFWTPD